ncbi:MAG: hypothetical protein PHH59_03215 [Methylovulum sp.]|nr:hypothetical protein [Methylovulum sp.]MDD5125227.1 hypothetical protein [Methylovulum sp.]
MGLVLGWVNADHRSSIFKDQEGLFIGWQMLNGLLSDVTQANEESMTYKAKNNCKLLIVRSRCVTSVIIIDGLQSKRHGQTRLKQFPFYCAFADGCWVMKKGGCGKFAATPMLLVNVQVFLYVVLQKLFFYRLFIQPL